MVGRDERGAKFCEQWIRQTGHKQREIGLRRRGGKKQYFLGVLCACVLFSQFCLTMNPHRWSIIAAALVTSPFTQRVALTRTDNSNNPGVFSWFRNATILVTKHKNLLMLRIIRTMKFTIIMQTQWIFSHFQLILWRTTQGTYECRTMERGFPWIPDVGRRTTSISISDFVSAFGCASHQVVGTALGNVIAE